MADERRTNHEFQWNIDPLFFSKQNKEEEQIVFGPELSWPLMSKPESQDVLKRQREQARTLPVTHRKAA